MPFSFVHPAGGTRQERAQDRLCPDRAHGARPLSLELALFRRRSQPSSTIVTGAIVGRPKLFLTLFGEGLGRLSANLFFGVGLRHALE
jgi:hypothetical protein